MLVCKSMCDVCTVLPLGYFVACGVSSLVNLDYSIGYIIGYIILHVVIITESDYGIGSH